MKIKTSTAFFFTIFFFIHCIYAQNHNLLTARNVFDDIKDILSKEDGKTWGVNLYGALMLVDKATREFIANEQNNSGSLIKKEGLFYGRLDDKAVIANTSINIDGKLWTMAMLPLPEDKDAMRTLIIHELFHSVQDKLNLKPDAGMNNHLDSKSARIYMRLEWNALLKAYLETDGNKRTSYIKDALLFRDLRRKEFTGASAKENCLELQEGLAEYTGLKLGVTEKQNIQKYIASKVNNAMQMFPSFIRAFAYVSGPLYGLLLDESGGKWRGELKPESDLGKLLGMYYSIEPETNPESVFEKRKEDYGFKIIEEFENDREIKNNKMVEEYRKGLVTGPVLMLPNSKMQFEFNPGELVSLGESGNVYPHFKGVAEWGVIKSEKGALVSSDWMRVFVSAPFKIEGNKVIGNGWVLVLNDGWEIVPYKEDCFTIKKTGGKK